MTSALHTMAQEPPQSTPSSSPFFRPSVQVGVLYQNLENTKKEKVVKKITKAPR
jgi:hypothetical protein